MNLRRLLKDRRGTLYEIPILVMFAVLVFSIGAGQKSIWKGLLGALLVMGGLFGIALLLGLAGEALERIQALAPLRDFLDSPAAHFARAALAYIAVALVWAVIAGFVSMFLMERVASTPAGQLLFGRSMVALGAVFGLAVCWKIRRQPPHF